MDFLLLGPFEARHHGERVDVASRRQERCLLAILLLAAGRTIPTERLLDLLWDGQPPTAARSAIHTYVGRLRTALQPYDVQILTQSEGYLIEPAGHTVDVERFTALVGEAADVRDSAGRVRLLDEAIGLWRGQFLAGLADDRLRQRLDAGLDELRLSSIELRAESQLSLGQHDRVITDLAPVSEQHPTRERLVGILMIALYRSGRQAEALAYYRATRDLLVRDLGIEPGPELRAVHQQVLRHDSTLDRSAAPVYAVRVRGHWLPWNVGGHPALEFCNTWAGWGGPPLPGSEWLTGYDALAAWAGHVDLVEHDAVSSLLAQAAEDPVAAAEVLRQARTLRDRLYACLADADDVGAFDAVARFVDDAARFSVFARDDNGLGRWRLSPRSGLRLPLHAAARSAADLLADPRRFTIQACPGAHCGWLFLDPGGRRTWCSMTTCGESPARTAA